jgi:histidine triad (HIT) family protein
VTGQEIPSHEPPGYACPFCAIVAGNRSDRLTEPEDVVERTPSTTAWISSRWWERNPGHVIVVPNEHVENMYALEQALAGSIHEAARRIALALRRVYGCEGVSTRQHNEPAGYQEVWHYHLHVFPRWPDDDLYGSPWRDTTPSERRPYADRLRAALLPDS